jgi:TrmH family RNA methyltransferase
MNNILDKIFVILVSPDESSNIGSICRAMKNMGITHLRIVNPKEYDENKISYISVHAYEIYENRQEFTSLRDALSDMSFASAATRRVGKRRKYTSFTPEETADFICTGNYEKAAIVFGNEKYGLKDDELKECTISTVIPSSPLFPSLNLSHAVQIMSYVLFSRFLDLEKHSGDVIADIDPNIVEAEKRASLSEVNSLAEDITASLEKLGFFKMTDDSDLKIFLRDIFSRANINGREKKKLKKLFDKIAGISAHISGKE